MQPTEAPRRRRLRLELRLRRKLCAALRLARAVLMGCALAGLSALAGLPTLAWAQGTGSEAPALDWRVVFKLINLTTHAEPGEAGYVREGDDSAESNEQSLRVQLSGTPQSWLRYQLDYLNRKQNSAAGLAQETQTGVELFRRHSLRRDLESAQPANGAAASTQQVTWSHELDRAELQWQGESNALTVGRFPIGWGAGRLWQPSDLFGGYVPTALDTEFKPGVDGLLWQHYPSEFSSFALAYILSRKEAPRYADSWVLRYRGPLGEESEATALAGSVREESVAGGSLETQWLEAGWRVEAVGWDSTESQAWEWNGITGVDYQFDSGVVVLAEWYHHSQGARTEVELSQAAVSRLATEGRLRQLARSVLGVAVQLESVGLWTYGYAGFASALRDATGQRPFSFLHQFTATYSVSDNAQAVFSVLGGSGKGLAGGTAPQSEFGALPSSFFVSIEFVL